VGRPIIFPDPMIRALLDGRKTQTRRVLRPQPKWEETPTLCDDGVWRGRYRHRFDVHVDEFGPCPYGAPGDLLWVRETWGAWPHMMGGVQRDTLAYRATDDAPPNENWRWRSPIHMPRWASRITLRLSDVRVQRVQNITSEDARAEGCGGDVNAEHWTHDAKTMFALQWDAINAKRGYPWESNPWVWVLRFEVIRKNVDEIASA